MASASTSSSSNAPLDGSGSSPGGSASNKDTSTSSRNYIPGGQLPPLNEDFLRCLHQAMAHYQNMHTTRTSPGREDSERILRPRVHVFESKSTNTVIATVEVPGLRKEEVQLVARDNQLFISGERRPLVFSDDAGRTIVNELKFGRFERAIPLPPGTEPSRISASMDDGMLTVSWPLRQSIDESDE